jgi:nucleotide-binding universal stress UspA family protein
MHVIEADISRKEPIDELMQQSKLAYDQYGEKYRKAKSILQDAEKVVAEIGKKIQVNLRIALGPVSAEIVRIAEEEKIGALFIGSTGSGKFKRMLMGSAADDVIHYAHCPVTVVR